jgi:hypothetical protein
LEVSEKEFSDLFISPQAETCGYPFSSNCQKNFCQVINHGSSPKELLMPELILFHQKENHKLFFTSPPLFPLSMKWRGVHPEGDRG